MNALLRAARLVTCLVTCLAPGLAPMGCASPRPCASDSGADAEPDASASLDAGMDAGVSSLDGGRATCASARPARLSLLIIPSRGPTGAAPCDVASDTPYRVRLYRRAGGELVYDHSDVCRVAGNVGLIEAGEYWLSVDSADLSAGARAHAPECATLPAPYCAPIPLTLRPCEDRVVPLALYCRGEGASCGTSSWPWER